MCYSRLMYLEFTVSQTMEHFLACHEHAFAAFHGCPRKVMVDNLKSAVLQRLVGQAPVFNPRYLDAARHWGFDIVACYVGKGNEKRPGGKRRGISQKKPSMGPRKSSTLQYKNSLSYEANRPLTDPSSTASPRGRLLRPDAGWP
nr:hypothetical protein [Paraburkholderia franconis]